MHRCTMLNCYKKPWNESTKWGLLLHGPWKIHNSRSLHETLEGIMPNSRRSRKSVLGHLSLSFFPVFLFSSLENQVHLDKPTQGCILMFDSPQRRMRHMVECKKRASIYQCNILKSIFLNLVFYLLKKKENRTFVPQNRISSWNKRWTDCSFLAKHKSLKSLMWRIQFEESLNIATKWLSGNSWVNIVNLANLVVRFVRQLTLTPQQKRTVTMLQSMFMCSFWGIALAKVDGKCKFQNNFLNFKERFLSLLNVILAFSKKKKKNSTGEMERRDGNTFAE